MTAKAIEGDRQLCLDAGMDDYLCKPMRMEELEAVLTRWIPVAEQTADSVPASPALDPIVTASLRNLAAATDVSMLAEIYAAFASSAVDYIRNCQDALRDSAANNLAAAAHGLKGASANIGATTVNRLASQLEQLGRSGTLSGADKLPYSLASDLARVREELISLVPTDSSPNPVLV